MTKTVTFTVDDAVYAQLDRCAYNQPNNPDVDAFTEALTVWCSAVWAGQNPNAPSRPVVMPPPPPPPPVPSSNYDLITSFGTLNGPSSAWTNEAHPHGTPATYTQYNHGFADPPTGQAYGGGWLTVTHADGTPHGSTFNSRLAFKGFRAYAIQGSKLTLIADAKDYHDVQQWTEDFQASGSSGGAAFRDEPALGAGAFSVKPALQGSTHLAAHGWTGVNPRPSGSPTLVVAQVSIVKDNPSGPDDRAAAAKAVIGCLGSDQWDSPGNNNNQAVFGKYVFAPGDGSWRKISATNATAAQLSGVDLSGVF